MESSEVEWKFHKCVEEPEFGPGLPAKMVYIIGTLDLKDEKLNGTVFYFFFPLGFERV